MINFPDGIQFQYPWRSYQKKFLDEFSSHISDNHLHIVAPPGSGKTVLGLEIMLRLNNPTLIVAPTLAIKNQWIQRFTELFLQTDIIPDWISSDIKNPGFITVTTYQGIHAAFSRGKEIDLDEEEEQNSEISELEINETTVKEIIRKLRSKKTGTIILDEAHHLKKAWWGSLMDLKTALNPVVVALTATPPYDVSGYEWQRYIQLNGAVDTEISVPELMLEKDLCPHQDLVYFSLPTEQEQEKIEKIYNDANSFIEELKKDDILLEALKNHPVYENPENFMDWIYENLSSYTSGLVYLNFRGIEINPVHFKIIGDEQKYIPELNVFWAEELLDFYLFVENSHLNAYTEHREKLENRLRRSGFLERRFVSFYENKNLNRIFNASIGKLDGIKTIANLEYDVLKSDLRMVILVDFIRKEYLSPHIKPDKIGAIPVFEKLRRTNSENIQLGLLTGSFVIIPQSAKHRLNEFYQGRNTSSVPFTELSYDSRFCILHQTEFIKHDLVHFVTQLFEEGYIQILIGTKSLLGEGWDAPKINSLILASFVSSFVSSNQMRGRSMRTDKSNPDKTSNVWHLISFDEHSETGGQDLTILKRRFKSFVGISNNEAPNIENNFERLHIPRIIEKKEDIESINQKMFVVARSRNTLSSRWNKALEQGNTLIEEIEVPVEIENRFNERKMNYVGKSLAGFSGIMISSFLTFWGEFLLNTLKHFNTSFFGKSVALFGVAGLFVYGRKFYLAAKQYLRYRNMSRNIEKIGIIMVKSLAFEKIIRTPIEQLRIVKSKDNLKNTSCHLEGGNRYERSQFILVLQEFVSPVDNSRYLLKQNKGFLKNRFEYFPVPEIFGRNKKSAEFFLKEWENAFGKAELFFTRTTEGRGVLLKLRFQSMIKANAHIKHIHKWTK